ncbi:MAG: DUF3048 domain-containing protein [Anaerolineae bacterium]|nr:MAG: DUF3048 domain-containing protein [Anaerolineae bacterium]
MTGSPTITVTGTLTETAEDDGSPTVTPTITPTPTPTGPPVVIPLIISQPTPPGYGPDIFPYNINPLTGLQVDDPALLERRPFAIKVVNYPRTVRPQSGLSLADNVYEYYMERGISRFIAVFYGNDAPRVGPIRSGRFFDEHIFRMYDAFFAFGYADERIADYFETLGDYWVQSLVLDPGENPQQCNPERPLWFCRDFGLVTYNNLFGNTAEMQRIVSRRSFGNHRPDLTGRRYAARPPAGGALALDVRVRFSIINYCKWDYDVASGRYLRYAETYGYADTSIEEYAPLIDAATGQHIAADNIVVLFTPYMFFVKTPTTEIVNVPLYGDGQAFVFRDGFAYPAVWVRPESGILQLYGLDGEIFPLKPGNTWFEVISTESTIVNGAIDWRFTHVMPPDPETPINVAGENAPWGIYDPVEVLGEDWQGGGD